MTKTSPFETFSERLDAYGSDLARWPAAEAEQARGLLGRSAEAAARHGEARRLDALVAAAARADTPNGFAFRVVAEIAQRRQDRFAWLFGSPGRFGLASASFCAAALGVGLVLGAIAGPNGALAPNLDLGAAIEVSLSDGDL